VQEHRREQGPRRPGHRITTTTPGGELTPQQHADRRRNVDAQAARHPQHRRFPDGRPRHTPGEPNAGTQPRSQDRQVAPQRQQHNRAGTPHAAPSRTWHRWERPHAQGNAHRSVTLQMPPPPPPRPMAAADQPTTIYHIPPPSRMAATTGGTVRHNSAAITAPPAVSMRQTRPPIVVQLAGRVLRRERRDHVSARTMEEWVAREAPAPAEEWMAQEAPPPAQPAVPWPYGGEKEEQIRHWPLARHMVPWRYGAEASEVIRYWPLWLVSNAQTSTLAQLANLHIAHDASKRVHTLPTGDQQLHSTSSAKVGTDRAAPWW